MKQVLQHLRSGETEVAEVPRPSVKPGHLLIDTRRSLISAGTERMLVEFGEAGYLEKARQQPERVRQVIEKIRTDGLFDTVDAVQTQLDDPMPLGYCNAGEVLAVGEGVRQFEPGDRVVSNGSHADVVCVPENLCAPIPEGVDWDRAAFGVAGAIALQSVRLAEPTLGERFAVSGLGLVGLLVVQFLRAHGCEVLGIDMKTERLELAEQFGAETVDLGTGADPVSAGRAFSGGSGIDGVIVAAATDSSEPIHQAAQMCRKRGRIVLVGVTGLDLNRSDFYEKEISFQVSCSYGPGRYDRNYEDKGLDYPIGFVRWTEQRNMQAVLEAIDEGRVDPEPLISHRHSIEGAADAYARLLDGEDDSTLGIVLEYEPTGEPGRDDDTVHFEPGPIGELNWSDLSSRARSVVHPGTDGEVVAGVVGAGPYADRTFLPALRASGCRLKTIVSRGGLSSFHSGRTFGFEQTSTDDSAVFEDPEIDAVFVLTSSASHSPLVRRSLEAGKHVFVEKPLAIDREQFDAVTATYAELAAEGEAPLLMVGFNRRFAPQVERMTELLEGVVEPKTCIMTVNAGEIPPDSPHQDPEASGGRIVEEGCHFVDLLRHVVDAPIERIQSTKIGKSRAVPVREDKMTITLGFEDGSIGTIHYFGNGSDAFPKERFEVFGGGKVLQLDNFRKLSGYGWSTFGTDRNLWQDKGHQREVDAFVEAVGSGGPSPIPFDQIVEVTDAVFEAVERARS
ncbi:MAG: bi-domain-containing oxidoreductase [Bradymonadaceae bacterium]